MQRVDDKTTAAHNQNSIVLFPPVPNAVYLNCTVFFWFPNVCLCRYKCLSYVEVLFTFLVKKFSLNNPSAHLLSSNHFKKGPGRCLCVEVCVPLRTRHSNSFSSSNCRARKQWAFRSLCSPRHLKQALLASH